MLPTGKEFDDVNLKLDGIRNLPSGAGPIHFIKDFHDTAGRLISVGHIRKFLFS